MGISRWGPLIAALVLGGAAVADTVGWRPLKLDGHEVRWPRPEGADQTLTLTWRIAAEPQAYSDAINCQSIVPPDDMLARSNVAMTSFRRELSAAFAMWEQAANIVFIEAAPGAAAQITIGAQGQPEGRAFADVAFNHQGAGEVRDITRSLICLNPKVGWKIGFDGNLDVYDLRFTLAHEIGHAIGLDHPASKGSLMWFRYDERSARLQRGDIEGAVALYGARASSLDPVGGLATSRLPASGSLR